MSEIGSKMFKGAGLGAGVGAVGGGVYGYIKAQGEIEKLPTETVTLSKYDQPLYEEKIVGKNIDVDVNLENLKEGDTSGTHVTAYDVKAKYPLKNPDGTVKMDHMPARTITGHGKAIMSEVSHPIEEPSNIGSYQSAGDNYGNGVGYNKYTTVEYRTIGHWLEPTVNFETGVSLVGNILGYAAAFAVAGGIGGAVIAAVLDKAGA
jgi:hypothetical protein